MTYTIKVLSAGTDAAGKEVRTVLFQRTSAGESIELSAEIDGVDLLGRLPDLLEATLHVQRALWPAQRAVSRLRSGFFPLLAEEARLVRRLTHGDEAPGGDGEMERRRLAREAMIVRDVAWEALRQVLPPSQRAQVDALVAVHETPAELVASMEALAALVERMLGDEAGAPILAACDIDAAYAAALRRQAAVLRAAEAGRGPGARARPALGDRGLLRLIGMAYRALSTEAFMAVPRAAAPPRATPPST